jgi:hypothetical protein
MTLAALAFAWFTAVAPIDVGADVLDPQRRQIGQQLRHQSPTDPLTAIVRIDSDCIHHCRRLDAPELAKIDANHDEADRPTVVLRHQRHAHVRFIQRFLELALEISGAAASGDPAIDRDQRVATRGREVIRALRRTL